ncbi:MAG: Rne/Rng family ribonuclease [Hydrogenobacter thermophilus]|uniref:Rne/Rng family ribonuclease n=1 Tax=Hydrogenobacter thermophilus TaxID=940 RepID=UPI001C757ABD|nr:Rne/Rng family ribonuclease [Hydrogenobacter thermophilus]QWK18954.1 MAG: Rne/Rng family ribonuclease [Hydrogenobacter thermophilus]
MAKNLIVLSDQERFFSLLIDDGEVSKIKVERRGAIRLVDSIFKGKVKKLVKGMDGVFVDIGLEKEAYLPIKQNCKRNGEEIKPVRVGEEVLVQVVREPVGEKGAKLTSRIRLVGKYLIYLPNANDVKFSSRLEEEDRKRLKAIALEVLPRYGFSCGVIFRRHASKASEEEIIKDIDSLKRLWLRILKKFSTQKKAGLLLEEYPNYIKMIKDHWYELGEMVVDNPYVWNDIVSFLEEFEPSLVKKVVYIKDVSAYINRYRIHDTFRKMLSKYVWLRGGGYIVIEETEAMTVIDVNSGEPYGESHEENALNTNLEAAKEIAKHIMLRDIGGIIVIDFIDMKRQENRDLVIKTLQESFGDEACNVQIYGFTRLGLLEMARKKSGESVSSLLTESCPLCKGRGKVRGKSLLAFELEKDLRREPHGVIDLHVNPQSADTVRSVIEKNGFKYVNMVEDANVEYNDYEIHYRT